MHRRHLLQFTGSTIASIAASQWLPQLQNNGDRALASLSGNSGRKLALLVGVNQYQGMGIRSLRGCGMDLEMQRELLIARFGFRSSDILMLHDDAEIKPTRDNILKAYQEHLIAQAKPNDVVVFHFSGHGAQVNDPEPIAPDGILGTIVPIDRPNKEDSSLDITGRTLFLLTQSLQTDRVTTIVDACHSGGSFRFAPSKTFRSESVNQVLRALPNTRSPLPLSDREVAIQTQLLKQLKLSPTEFQRRRQAGIAKGIAFGSAHRNQYSADTHFGDFYAGAFSYLLTRSLWQAARDASIGQLFFDLARATEELADQSQIVQTPVLEIAPTPLSATQEAPVYFTPSVSPSAEGVLKTVQGDRVELWLGGIPAQTIDTFRKGAIFEIFDENQKPIAQVQQTGRSGLTATAKILSGNQALRSGQWIQEKVRGIPVEIKLTIALQTNSFYESKLRQILGDHPRFNVLPRARDGVVFAIPNGVAPLEYDNSGVWGETPSTPARDEKIDVLIELSNEHAIVKTPDGRVIHEGTFSSLIAPLQSLLAAKVLRLLANGNSARLPVQVVVRRSGSDQPVSQSQTRSASLPQSNHRTTAPPLKPGDTIEIDITNQSDRALYAAAVAIGSDGNLTILYPLGGRGKAQPIDPKQTLTIPNRAAGNTYRLTLQPPAGSLELLTFASTEPLGDILRGLKQLQPNRSTPISTTGQDALSVVGDLLGLLDRSAVKSGNAAIDNSQFALLSMKLTVIE